MGLCIYMHLTVCACVHMNDEDAENKVKVTLELSQQNDQKAFRTHHLHHLRHPPTLSEHFFSLCCGQLSWLVAIKLKL